MRDVSPESFALLDLASQAIAVPRLPCGFSEDENTNAPHERGIILVVVGAVC
jgi:hypothetical protein